MRQAVSFKCNVCKRPIKHSQFFVRLTSPGLVAVHRFCSVSCIRQWLGWPPYEPPAP